MLRLLRLFWMFMTSGRLLLDVHDQWEAGAETRAVELVQSVQNQFDSLPVFTLEELQRNQEQATMSIIMPFVTH